MQCHRITTCTVCTEPDATSGAKQDAMAGVYTLDAIAGVYIVDAIFGIIFRLQYLVLPINQSMLFTNVR